MARRELTEGDRKRLLRVRERIIELANRLSFRGADLHDPQFAILAAAALREIARVATGEAYELDVIAGDRELGAWREGLARAAAKRRSEAAKSGWEVRRAKKEAGGA